MMFFQVTAVFLLSCVLVDNVACQTGLTDSEKQAVLDAHNRLRGQVIPSASNMERMVWNDELARVAQNYAEQCVFRYNSYRVPQQNTFQSVGENLAAGTGSLADVLGFVQNWYDEVQAYDFESDSCSSECGHYTQVVWATSRNLGCGAFRCENLQGILSNALNFVCNYGPGSNCRGSPYMSGATCSTCPEDSPFCVNGLCCK